jgi:sugar/nucleoside kinase (ribokinase family)
VAVVGNLCWDVIVRGLPDLPRWGEEAEGDDNLQAPGGQAFNLAAALAALGRRVTLTGALGDDAAGRQMLAALSELEVATDGVVVDPALPTAVTAALVRTDGERAFASDFGCQRTWGLPQILERWDAAIAAADVLCLVGQFNVPGLPVADAAQLLARARTAGITTVLDTGWDPQGWTVERRQATRALLAHVDVFLPNQDEARALTGLGDPAAAAAELLADGAGTVVVKCGGAGSVGSAGGAWARAGVLDVTVRDAVGAGDTFDAGFVAGALEGQDLAGRMALGSAAAGLRVSSMPPAWPTADAARAAAREVAVDA